MNDPDLWDDMPGSYHDGACVFAFADGHSEIHKWLSAKTSPGINYGRTEIRDPGSVDIQWMHNHTSAP